MKNKSRVTPSSDQISIFSVMQALLPTSHLSILFGFDLLVVVGIHLKTEVGHIGGGLKHLGMRKKWHKDVAFLPSNFKNYQ
jgi:hypothetical protein